MVGLNSRKKVYLSQRHREHHVAYHSKNKLVTHSPVKINGNIRTSDYINEAPTNGRNLFPFNSTTKSLVTLMKWHNNFHVTLRTFHSFPNLLLLTLTSLLASTLLITFQLQNLSSVARSMPLWIPQTFKAFPELYTVLAFLDLIKSLLMLALYTMQALDIMDLYSKLQILHQTICDAGATTNRSVGR